MRVRTVKIKNTYYQSGNWLPKQKFGFLNFDLINDNDDGTTTLSGEFYTNKSETTIKDQFTVTKSISTSRNDSE
jgi:hypothetical protein